MSKLMPPSEIPIGLSLKRALGSKSKDPVIIGNRLIILGGEIVSYHDLYHLEVSCLPRIQMGKYQVSGIHGIDSPILHEFPIISEYNALFDEARVSFHEWLTRPSIFNTFKLIGWMLWLIFQGINPISVLIRHMKAMNMHNIFLPLMEKLNFVDANNVGIQELLAVNYSHYS